MSLKRSLAFSIVLCVQLLGCAAPRVAPPAVWPATFSGRPLFYLRNQLVYTHDASSAEQAAIRVDAINREFKHRTGEQPTSGLIVVNDVQDTTIGNLKPDQLLLPAQKDGKPDMLGMSWQEFSLAMTLPIAKDQLARQSVFTPAALQTIQWSTALPSNRRTDQFENQLLDAGIKQAHLNFFQRALLLPFMPMVHGILNDFMNAEEDTVLYAGLCNAQKNWSEGRRRQEAEAYAHDRMGQAMKSLQATTRHAAESKK